MAGITAFEKFAKRYDAWFERHPGWYDAELRALRALLPKSALGIEIGVGSGRFAFPLGIRWGVDPAVPMLELARARGIQAVSARAEALPFKSDRFDLVLFVTTLCFLDNPEAALKEAHRVLSPGGNILIGILDPDSPPGAPFFREKKGSPFFQGARYHSVESVASLMRKTGFNVFEFRQVLRQKAHSTDKAAPVEEGYGQGLFAVIKATKSEGKIK